MLENLKEYIFPELDKLNIDYKKMVDVKSLDRDQAFSLID